MPKISVIICQRNSEKFIEKCINSVIQQDFKDFELIIVDDYSTDNTKRKIKEIINELKEKETKNSEEKTKKLNSEKSLAQKKQIKLIELPFHSGISKARNSGIKNSSGKIIAFIDSDAFPKKNWLKELLNGFQENVVSVGGPNLVPIDSGKNEKIFDEVLELISVFGSNYVKNSDKIIEVKHNPSCNSAYTKKILEEMKGFNETLSSNEDPELDFRIKKTGKKIVFNPKAVVYHHRKDSVSKIFRQAFWFGKGRIQVIKIHSELAECFRIIPSMSILALINLFFYGLIVSELKWFFYFIFLLFSVLILISFIAVIKFKRFSIKYFLFLTAWFFGYGFGMLRGIK